MLPDPLNNFKIQKYNQNKSKFNGVYSRNDLPKVEDGAYVINLDEHESIETHWITLYMNDNYVKYFNSFEVEHIPKEIEKFISNKNIKYYVCRIKARDSIMCGYFSIIFVDFILKGEILLDYTNLFFPNKSEKNDKIILQ